MSCVYWEAIYDDFKLIFFSFLVYRAYIYINISTHSVGFVLLSVWKRTLTYTDQALCVLSVTGEDVFYLRLLSQQRRGTRVCS